MAITEWEIGRTAIGQREIRAVLCDDDSAFLSAMQQELVGVFKKLNIDAAIAAYRSPADLDENAISRGDLFFLDIDYESKTDNGIDAARKIRQVNQDGLIFFVTNFIEYAPAGYEVRAFRYILKRERSEVLERYLLQAMETLAEGDEYLRLYEQDLTVDVPLHEIDYLEVMDHYVSVHAGDRTHVLSSTLSSLEHALEGHGFLRVHKSYLVNMARICKFRSRECRLVNGVSLAVGEKSYPQQKQKYLHWKGLK